MRGFEGGIGFPSYLLLHLLASHLKGEKTQQAMYTSSLRCPPVSPLATPLTSSLQAVPFMVAFEVVQGYEVEDGF